MRVEDESLQFQQASDEILLGRAKAVAIAFFLFHLFTTALDLVHLDLPFIQSYFSKIPMVVLSIGIFLFAHAKWMAERISVFLCLLMLSLLLSVYIKSLQYGDYAPIASVVVFSCLFSAYFLPWRFGFHLAVTIGAMLLVSHWAVGLAAMTDLLNAARATFAVASICIATAFLAFFEDSKRFNDWREKQRLLRSDRMFKQFGEYTSDIVFIWNPDLSIDYVSPSFEQYTGRSVEQLLTTELRVSEVIAPSHRDHYHDRVQAVVDGQEARMDLTVVHLNGTEYHFEVFGSPIHGADGKTDKAIAVWHDVSARSAKEKFLQQMAIRDSLTRVFNQDYMQKLAIKELEDAQQENVPVHFVYLDIDDFRKLIEQNGHAAGELAIVEVVERCRGLLDEDSVVGRFGGDGFLVMLPNKSAQYAEAIAAGMIERVSETPILHQDRLLPISVSAGLAGSTPENRLSYEEVLDSCALALYQAKREGRGSFGFYCPTEA